MARVPTGAGAGFRTVRYGALDVAYRSDLDGGGMGFGQTYVPVVKELWGRVGRVHEFCAGPGFIGFALLAHGLCDSLCLSDVNPDAVQAARETVRRNRLEDRVAVYLSDALDGIAAAERWDLVVSNPPHFRSGYEGSLRHHDPDWECHRRFYGGVPAHLNPGASVLIQENYEGSDEREFTAMIGEAGLQPLASLMYRGGRNYFDSYYFLWSRAAGALGSRPESGASFTLVSGEAELVALDLDAPPATLELQAHRRYRIRLANAGTRAAALSVWSVRFGVARFLRSFCRVPAGADITTYAFQWLPGRYRIRDEATGRTVARIRARA
jgi:hypothetical protein